MGAQESRSGGAPASDAVQRFMDDPWKSLGMVYYPDGNDSDDEDSDIDKVLDGLYIGGMHGALDLKALYKHGITHILNMANYTNHPKAHHDSEFEYMIVNAEDVPSERIIRYFEDTNRFISQGRQRGAVYVQCRPTEYVRLPRAQRTMTCRHAASLAVLAGMSRAPTAVTAYLMAEQGMSLREAASTVKAARRQALPNRGFWQQLNEYESQLVAASQDSAGGVRFGHGHTQAQADDSPQIISASRQTPLGDAKASMGWSRGRTRGNAQERPEAVQIEERSRDARDSILGSGAVDYWK